MGTHAWALQGRAAKGRSQRAGAGGAGFRAHDARRRLGLLSRRILALPVARDVCASWRPHKAKLTQVALLCRVPFGPGEFPKAIEMVH